MSRVLDVYLRDIKVGYLVQDESAQLSFSYDREYLSHAKVSISVAMPLREEPYGNAIARPFFSGLLPDERPRQVLASKLGVSRENTFGLLEIIGGECAGALSLLPQGQHPALFTQDDAEVLEEKQLLDVLSLLRKRPLFGGEQGVRLSLAGAQDKLAVCVIDGQIALPKEGRPTTHILKPFIEGLEGTVENELFCMMLAKRMGLDAPLVSKSAAGNIEFILVERYDRQREENGLIQKLHQEDFCQALSVAPEMKYEDEGGPDVVAVQGAIQRFTRSPALDSLTFRKMLIFHYLVGNADAHAKNYALLYRNEVPDLAPLYDVVCTAAYPNLSQKMAMKLGGRHLPDTIQLEHWLSLVLPTAVAQRLLKRELANMAEAIEDKADLLINELKEMDTHHAILDKVRHIIAKRARLLLHALRKV